MEFPEIIPDFYHLTQKLDTLDHCYILNIVLSSTHFQQEELSSFVNLLATYYENKVEIPLIALTVSEKFDSSILQTLSPVILNFPSLDERSEIEVLQLTLSMIQQESIRLAKNISISVDFYGHFLQIFITATKWNRKFYLPSAKVCFHLIQKEK